MRFIFAFLFLLAFISNLFTQTITIETEDFEAAMPDFLNITDLDCSAGTNNDYFIVSNLL
ncbi:MAG: hypothetical protein GX259_11170 [Bacteroidales bacterium]|jgi:hypothetical protein|nr:hypothetical protein [Bacteroidales bacterium]